MAHDINNALGIILSNSETALNKVPTGHAARINLELVNKAAKRAAGVVEQILSFSRVSEGSHRPIRADVVVLEALKMLRATLPTTIEIQQDIPDSTGDIMADPVQIHQVVTICAPMRPRPWETGAG